MMADDKLLNDDNDRTVPFDSNRSLRKLNYLSKSMRRTWIVRKIDQLHERKCRAAHLAWPLCIRIAVFVSIASSYFVSRLHLVRHANHQSQGPDAINHGAYRMSYTQANLDGASWQGLCIRYVRTAFCDG